MAALHPVENKGFSDAEQNSTDSLKGERRKNVAAFIFARLEINLSWHSNYEALHPSKPIDCNRVYMSQIVVVLPSKASQTSSYSVPFIG